MQKEKSLGKKARTGISWNLIGNLLKQVVIVAVSIYISRVIDPQDFGVVAIALIFVSFSQIFVDVGFTEGIIQKLNISDRAISSVFYFNLAVSTVLALLVILFSPWIGSFFENAQVAPVVSLIALVLPISALGKVHSAILTKELRLKEIAFRDIVSVIAGGIVGVFLVSQGYGVYSIVWQQLTTAALGTVMFWYGSRWIPKLEFSYKELKELLSFSIYVFLDTILQTFFNKMDTLFVGKVFSPAMLGLYSRADTLRSMVNDFATNSLNKVIFPIFSAIQDDQERFKRVFTKSIGFIVVVTTILSGIMFFSAEAIIVGLLGEKWRMSISFFQILIFSTISLPLRTVVFKAILGLGLSKAKLKLGLVNNLIRMASIPVGYFYGIYAFAWTVVVGRFLIVIVSWVVFQRLVSFSLGEVVKPLFLPVGILFFWVGLYYTHWLEINMLFFIPPFLLSLIFLLKITSNFGYVVLMEELVTIKKRVFKKGRK